MESCWVRTVFSMLNDLSETGHPPSQGESHCPTTGGGQQALLWLGRQTPVPRFCQWVKGRAGRQLLRDLNEEVTVWTGAAIYRRFHPACAASYMLRADGCDDQRREDVVEGYADGWRAPREHVRPVEAARQWLLSEATMRQCRDQRAWGSLRGDLFTTVTVTSSVRRRPWRPWRRKMGGWGGPVGR
eukprot:Skav232277  [mRNA]  locus=scaffold882:227089:236738:- [translate_table: standard]